MGCIQSKSRNNKLNPVSKSTEILTKTNPLSSSLLGEEYSTHDSEQDPEFRRVSSGYSAPAVAHRTSSGTRRLDTFASDAYTDDEGTSNPMNTPSSTVVDNLISMDGMDVPPNGQPTASPVRAVAGTTILGFEHPFKQESFKKRGQMVMPIDSIACIMLITPLSSILVCLSIGQELEAAVFRHGRWRAALLQGQQSVREERRGNSVRRGRELHGRLDGFGGRYNRGSQRQEGSAVGVRLVGRGGGELHMCSVGYHSAIVSCGL